MIVMLTNGKRTALKCDQCKRVYLPEMLSLPARLVGDDETVDRVKRALVDADLCQLCINKIIGEESK